jgi:hypothetical protein
MKGSNSRTIFIPARPLMAANPSRSLRSRRMPKFERRLSIFSNQNGTDAMVWVEESRPAAGRR